MITNAADYRYITNPGPIAAGIRGGILPARDGTASACVETYEDYCYLVEMARERQDWSGFHGFGQVVPYFNSESLVATRYRVLDDIAAAASQYVRDLSTNNYDGLIRHDANLVGQTFYGRGTIQGISQDYEISAVESMGKALGITRATPTGRVPRVADVDTLRRLYYDFGRMKRYLFRTDVEYNPSNVISPSDFENEEISWYSGKIYVPVEDNGRRGRPFFGLIHEQDSLTGNWRNRATYPETDRNYTFYITKPFWKNPSGQAYYSELTPYTLWGGALQRQGYNDQYFTIIMGGLNDLTVTANAGAHSDVFEGYVRLLFPASDQYAYARQVLNQAISWITGQIGAFDDSKTWAADIELTGVFFDTGAIEHVSNLPSSWQWTPPA